MIIKRLGRIEAEEFSELAAVLGILMDTELEVLAKRLIELCKVILVLGNLSDKIKGLLHNVLANNLKNLVLLERFARDVQRKILRVNNTLHKVQVLGNELVAVVHDEDTADVELDVVSLLLRLKEIEGCPKSQMSDEAQQSLNFHSPLRNEKNSLELKLTLDGEVLDGKVVFPVVGQTLVERGILFSGDLLRITRPDGLRLIELLVGDLLLFDGLLLFLLSVLLLLIYLFDLGFFTVLFLGFLLIFDLLEDA